MLYIVQNRLFFNDIIVYEQNKIFNAIVLLSAIPITITIKNTRNYIQYSVMEVTMEKNKKNTHMYNRATFLYSKN